MKVEGVEEVLHNWERLKAEEKKERKHCLEGIPKTLGSLARAQKIIDKMIRKKINLPEKIEEASNEETVGRKLLDLIIQAQKKGVDAESALRRSLKSLEDLFKN